MSFDNMDIQTGNDKFITLKAGESVQINIISEEPMKSINHWVNKKKLVCTGKACEICKSGDSPRQGWKVNVIDRKDGKTKEYEFGTQVAIHIKEIASILRESEQTVHDIDLRIKRVGSGQFDTEYFVNQVPKKSSAPVQEEPKTETTPDEECPF